MLPPRAAIIPCAFPSVTYLYSHCALVPDLCYQAPRVASSVHLGAAVRLCYTTGVRRAVKWQLSWDRGVGMSASSELASLWPADVIHVNEDGWVLINRGGKYGVAPGLRLMVVGSSIRDLRDLYAPGADQDTPTAELPVALRLRRTYELLEVVHVEECCAIAIAARVPPDRRPTIYRGPEGELLVWVPLTADFTWPRPGDDGAADANQADEPDDQAQDGYDGQDGAEADDDAPPERMEQEDERWELALPLNSVSVGDIVLPALPAASQAATAEASALAAATSSPPASTDQHTTPFDAGRSYDWMKPQG